MIDTTSTSTQADPENTQVPSIELRDMVKAYPGAVAPALAGLTLTILDGEFFSLLGPSGSGKTTTLRLVAGFDRPDSGVVMLDGRDVTKIPPYRRNVNTVFQNYALFPHMNVAKNVQYPLRMKNSDRSSIAKAASDALNLVGMESYSRRLPHELSGGQRQRVALARALVSRPKVVLLDEPLGALDLQLRQRMQVVLKDIHQHLGITFVYVTHDQGEALAMSDRVAVMNEGRIEQCSTAEDIYYRPETRFVAGFIGKSNLLEGTISNGVLQWAGLNLQMPRTCQQSGQATVAVRTEAIRIAPRSDRSRNTLTARIHQRVFLGDADEVVLNVNSHELTARITASDRQHCQVGQEVTIQISPEDLRVVK